MREFKLPNCDPWDSGHKVYKRTKFVINSGMTILTGCNGAGKTTLIRFLKDNLRNHNDVAVCHYDNLRDGKDTSMQEALVRGDMTFLSGLALSSEGECINLNLIKFIRKLAEFAKTLNPEVLSSRLSGLSKILLGNKEEISIKELWVFLDATDSGLSINSIIDLKDVLHDLESKFRDKGIDTYILIAANEYEMCIDEDCLDVQSLTYRRYKTYNSYKKAILKSYEYKKAQLEKAESKQIRRRRYE